MELIDKKYLFSCTALSCLAVTIALFVPILSLFNRFSAFIDSPDALVIARDIKLYTQHADIIVVGNVHSVSDPYLLNDLSVNLQQDAQIDAQEVLKGDQKMTNVRVSDLAYELGELGEGFSTKDGVATLKGKFGLLKPDEKVLLFLGKNAEGNYVIFGRSYGKYVIDSDGNVSSAGDFRMSLNDLKKEIGTALLLPVEKRVPPLPISVEN